MEMEYIRTKLPIRIQFTCYSVLVAECIVQGTSEADRVYAAYVNLKYKLGKPMGGACHYRADIKRLWDLPVGAEIPDDYIKNQSSRS